MPDLAFEIEGAEAVPDAAGPMIALRLGVSSTPANSRIHGVLLRYQVRLEGARRAAPTAAEAERLRAVFGAPADWGRTLRSLLWSQASTSVAAFEGKGSAEIALPCSSDFALATTAYFNALEGGDVPLSVLFSGTVFHETPEGVRAAPIPWSSEARFAMPLTTYREALARHFGDSAAVALRRDVLERLTKYRASRGLAT
jgi:hypothetical protein